MVCSWKGVPQSRELVSQNGKLTPSRRLPPDLCMMPVTIRFSPQVGQI
jgi:hypothetical protein